MTSSAGRSRSKCRRIRRFRGKTLEKLDTYVQACDGVIHLIGDATGSIPGAAAVKRLLKRYPDIAGRLKPLAPDLAGERTRISYTQWEAYLAIYHGRPVFIYSADSEAPRDKRFVPNDAQKQSQKRHYQRICALERDWGTFANHERLSSKVLRDLVDILPSLGKIKGVDIAPSRFPHHAGKLIGRVALWTGSMRPGRARIPACWLSTPGVVSVKPLWSRRGGPNGAQALERARRVFDWSFYHLGTRPQGHAEYQGASSDRFFAEALAFFGETDPLAFSGSGKGGAPGRAGGARRSLLVLDGLEPLQYPPGHRGGLAGRLKDPRPGCTSERAG